MSEQFSKAWKRLALFLCPKAFGSLVTHDVISGVLGMSYPSHEYYQAVSQAVAYLRRSHGKNMDTVQGRGYVVLHPNEHRTHAAKFISQGEARLQIASEVLRSNNSTLNATHLRAVIRADAAVTAVVAVVKEVATELRKAKPPLRPNVEAIRHADPLEELKLRISDLEARAREDASLTPAIKALYMARDVAKKARKAVAAQP